MSITHGDHATDETGASTEAHTGEVVRVKTEAPSQHTCCGHPITVVIPGSLVTVNQINGVGTSSPDTAPIQGYAPVDSSTRVIRILGAVLGAAIGLILILVFGPVSGTPVRSPHLIAATHADAVAFGTLIVLSFALIGLGLTILLTRRQRVATPTTTTVDAPASELEG
jgi:hypothetical protein